MATFPALTPSDAPLTPGRWGGTQISNLAGGITPVRHSSTESGRGLSLSFTLTQAELYQLRDHYLGQLSNMDGFAFTTTTIPASYTPAGSWWFYTSPPQITDEHADYFTVEIEVQSEPMPLFTLPGGAFHVRPLLAIGSPTGIALGTALTVSRSLTTGAVTGFVAGVALTVGQSAVDPLFSQVQLLLHCNGNFTDSSSAARTVVNNGAVQFDATHSVAGSSGYVPTGTRWLSITGGIDIPANTQATLEIWFRATSVADFGLFGDNLIYNGQLLAVVAGKLRCFWGANDIQGGTVNANQAHRAAVTRDSSGIVRLFLDGVLVATAGAANNAAFRVGDILRAPFRGDFLGWFDEVRVTVGATACRYTSTYTVSSVPFPDSQYSSFTLTPGSPV